ncbi:MAG: hypothetical protein HQ508_01760 [Candidatus Marinimicrobia bacterium]|nr:hypothetical protein [Candidatus Neomarinimicrobiota bacterium]
MSKILVLLTVLLPLSLFWGCDVNENNQTAAIEESLLKIIAADDSTYGIDGMEDIEDDDFALGKASEWSRVVSLYQIESLRDSNYVWRFGRRDMSRTREITIEVEDDSSALALITHTITGTFHVRQFERVWTDAETWERGDSVRFSEKPIEMTSNRRVAFRKRMDTAGEERWQAVAMTLVYGQSGEAVTINSMEWVAEDSVLVLSDFDSVLYDRRTPLLMSFLGTNRINVLVDNNVPGDAEMVMSRLGYHPRLNGAELRNRVHFNYVETNDSGEKIYSKRIFPAVFPQRHFKGFIEVIDHRTLFDHDYALYSSATLGFVYTARQHVRP